MALSLKDPETDRLAREVSRLTGESLTEAVRVALRERLKREQLRREMPHQNLAKQLDSLATELPTLADIAAETGEEAIEYDEIGMWR